MFSIVVLAGGLGKRMKSDLPKVLHLVHGQPMIIKILKTAVTTSPNKILVVVGKNRSQIESTICKYLPSLEIQYVEQEQPLGTGHAIKCCVPFLSENEKVVILSGDVPFITSETILNLYSVTKDCGLIVAQVENPFGLGRIILKDGEFDCICEEKDCSEEQKKIRWINSGIYCIKLSLILKYIDQIQNQNSQQEYYLTDLIGRIKSHTKIHLHILEPQDHYQVLGVNNQDELEVANGLNL